MSDFFFLSVLAFEPRTLYSMRGKYSPSPGCVKAAVFSSVCVCALGTVADSGLGGCSLEAAHLGFGDRYFHRPCYRWTFPPAGHNVHGVWIHTEDGGHPEDLNVAVLLSHYKGSKCYTSVAHIL